MAPEIGYREMIALSALMFLLVIALSAGAFHGVEEMVNPDISMRVEKTWISNTTGDNMTPVSGKVWQFVQVNITNHNKKQPLMMSIYRFYAYTDSNERIWIYNSDDTSYPTIQPSQNGTVILLFHIKEGTSIRELEYLGEISSSVRCRIPPPGSGIQASMMINLHYSPIQISCLMILERLF